MAEEVLESRRALNNSRRKGGQREQQRSSVWFFLSLPRLVISIDLIAGRETDLASEFVFKLPLLLLLY